MASPIPEFQDVLLDVDGPVATVTLNRPASRNGWTLRLGAEMGEALAICDEDDDIRVVVVTGAGRDFCVGADLSGRSIGAPGGAVAPTGRPVISPPEMCKPVIAAMNGHAVGIGITFPMQCDIRIVAEEAKVGLPFVRRGVIAEVNGHWMLPRLIGMAAAADLLLTGRLISGREAAAIGLCSRAVPADEVLPEARRVAAEMAATAAPASMAATKRMLWDALEMTRADAVRREGELFRWLADQPDAVEGVASFLEKRPPVWTLSPSTELPQAGRTDH